MLIIVGSFVWVPAQVTLEKGIASVDGKPWLTVTKTQKSSYLVRDLLGYDIALLTSTNKNDKVQFKAQFMSLGLTYETYYPAGTSIQAVLESYHKNGVIVEGKISQTGLQGYCEARKINITGMRSLEEQKYYDDSLKSKGKFFSFAIHGGLAYSLRTYPQKMRSLSYNSPSGYHHGATYQFDARKVKGVLTGNVNLGFEFRLRKSLYLELGLNYSKVAYQIRDSVRCYTTTWYDSSPKVYQDTVNNFKFREEYYFASLPVGLFYRLDRDEHFYTFGAGAAFTVLFRSATFVNYSMASNNAYTYSPVISSPIVFAKAGAFGKLDGGKALGFELEFKYYGNFRSSDLFTLGGNLVLKL
jgi:hypothetical protein